MKNNKILQDTIWLFASYMLRLGLQAVSFVLIARMLGPNEFGIFSTFSSLCILLGPFVELGGYYLIIRDINLGISVNDAFGIALKSSSVVFLFVILGVFAICAFILPSITIRIIFPIGFGMLFFSRITNMTNGVNSATGKLWKNAVSELIGGLVLILCVSLIFVSKVNKDTVYMAIFLQYFVSATFNYFQIQKIHGNPNFLVPGLRKRLLQGFSYGTGVFAYGANNELDKTILAKLTSSHVVGNYGAASRIIGMSYVPITAFLNAAYPRLSKIWLDNTDQYYERARIVFYITLAYGLIVSTAIYFSAPFISNILGPGYSETTQILQLISGIVVIQSMQFPLIDALNISGLFYMRTVFQIVSVVISIAVNLIFVPNFLWIGSVIALFSSSTFFLLFLISYNFHLRLKMLKNGPKVV
jgi:O-antigen/teichoic acid export membrane protein